MVQFMVTDIWKIMMKLLQSSFDHVDSAFNNLKMVPNKCIKAHSDVQFGSTYILEFILLRYYRSNVIQKLELNNSFMDNNLRKLKRLVFPVFSFK